MSISNIIDAGTKQIFPPLIPQSAVGVLSVSGTAPITIGGTAQNPNVSLGALNTNGIAVFNVSQATTTNDLAETTGPIISFPFASLVSSSGIGSGFSVNAGEIIWGGTSDIALTFTVPVSFATTLTAGGGTEEFTSVAPLNGGDPAGGVNPPYLNLYTHTGLVFNFQTLDTNNVIKQSSTQACASGCLVYVGNYSATLSYTTMMKPTDKLAMKFYSNSAFNQNWVGGPNANQYTITANAGNVIMFVNECPNP